MAEYIEKQAVIDEVDEWYNLYPDSDTAREALSFLKRFIKKLPPADVRPVVRGEWIDDGCITRCKYCGEEKEFPHWRFCPNCGADMRGAQDE